MRFCVWNLLVILWWPSYVKSGPVTQVNGTGLPLDQAQSTLQPIEENPETFEESNPNSTVLAVEGDILLQNDRNAVSNLWHTCDIPYEIDYYLESRINDILEAINMVTEKTLVKFHQHVSEPDFLFFEKQSSCASYVGCIYGKQQIYVASHCGVGNIVHELLHALGFHHEHTRMDRDRYIEVKNQNIQNGKHGNFEMYNGNTQNLDYDVNSIMHYGPNYFTRNGQPTIVPRDPHTKTDMGQRKQLTDLDIKKVRSLYKCGEADSSEP